MQAEQRTHNAKLEDIIRGTTGNDLSKDPIFVKETMSDIEFDDGENKKKDEPKVQENKEKHPKDPVDPGNKPEESADNDQHCQKQNGNASNANEKVEEKNDDAVQEDGVNLVKSEEKDDDAEDKNQYKVEDKKEDDNRKDKKADQAVDKTSMPEEKK